MPIVVQSQGCLAAALLQEGLLPLDIAIRSLAAWLASMAPAGGVLPLAGSRRTVDQNPRAHAPMIKLSTLVWSYRSLFS